MPTAHDIRRWGDNAIGAGLITVFLAASLMADLYGVSVVMDNTYSTWNQGLIAGGCVLVKACGFYKMRSAWREGYWPAACAMAVLTCAVLIVSITNEMTYYNTNFSNKAAKLQGAKNVSVDTAQEKTEITDRLDAAADVRPTGTIEAAITLALNHPVKRDRLGRSLGEATKDCTATRSNAYAQCNGVLALRTELANAVVVWPQVDKDRARLDVIRQSKDWVTTIGDANPGAGFWVRSYNRIVDYRGLGAEHYITSQDGQDALVIVAMLVLQFLNLFLPFAWFYRRPEKERVAIALKPSRAVRHVLAGNSCDASNDLAGGAHEYVGENDIRNDFASKFAGGASNIPGKKLIASDARETCPLLADIKTFVHRYCIQGADFSERSGDVHAAYAAVTDLPNPLNHSHFSRQLRALVGGRLKENPRDHEGKSLMVGLKLNKEGRNLVAIGQFKEFGLSSTWRLSRDLKLGVTAFADLRIPR